MHTYKKGTVFTTFNYKQVLVLFFIVIFVFFTLTTYIYALSMFRPTIISQYGPRPADFGASFLTLIPSQLKPGEKVKVSAIITNSGEASGNHVVEVKLDGLLVDSELVTLDGGESVSVDFVISTETEGSHTVEVDGLVDRFTIQATSTTPRPSLLTPIALGVIIVVAVLAYYIYSGRLNDIRTLLGRLIARSLN